MSHLRQQSDQKTVFHSKSLAIFFELLLSAGIFYVLCSSPLKTLSVPSKMLPMTVNFEQFTEEKPLKTVQQNVLLAEESDFKVEKPTEIEQPKAEPNEIKRQENPDVVKVPEISNVQKPPKPKIEKATNKKLTPKELRRETSKTNKSAKSDGSSKNATSELTIAGNSREAEVKNQIASLLVALVERKKKYPKIARRNGIEGVVEVLFEIDTTGKVVRGTLVKSSGASSLDNATQDLAQRICGTDFNIDNKGLRIKIPIRYHLD